MTNRQWPIYASHDPSESAQIENGAINRSVVGSGCIVDGAVLDHAMLRRAVTVQRDAHLQHCIVMERSVIGQGVRIRRAIVDTDNEIPAGEMIGFDLEADRKRFHVTDSGIVVVPSGYFSAATRRHERRGFQPSLSAPAPRMPDANAQADATLSTPTLTPIRATA